MYATIIYSSPRRYGHSRRVAEIMRELFREKGYETDLYNVFEMNIKPCLGCVSDDVKLCRFPCVIDDDARKIFYSIDRSFGIVFISPIYWYNVPGPLKNLIDRLTVFENEIFISGRSRLEGKVVGFVVIGNDTGAIAVIQNLMVVMNSMGAVIPPWALAYYTGTKDPFEDRGFVLDIYNIVRSMDKMISLLRKEDGFSYKWYEASEEALNKMLILKEKIDEKINSENNLKGSDRIDHYMKNLMKKLL